VAQTNLPEKEITIAAYLISDVTVRKAEVFQTYRSRAAEAIAIYGGRYLVRGGEVQTLEGAWNPLETLSSSNSGAWSRREPGISLSNAHPRSRCATLRLSAT
jgi:hypothetical protein